MLRSISACARRRFVTKGGLLVLRDCKKKIKFCHYILKEPIEHFWSVTANSKKQRRPCKIHQNNWDRDRNKTKNETKKKMAVKKYKMVQISVSGSHDIQNWFEERRYVHPWSMVPVYPPRAGEALTLLAEQPQWQHQPDHFGIAGCLWDLDYGRRAVWSHLMCLLRVCLCLFRRTLHFRFAVKLHNSFVDYATSTRVDYDWTIL